MATNFDDLTAEESKQMEEMRQADSLPPEPAEVVVPDEPKEAVGLEDVEKSVETVTEEPKENTIPYGALRKERDQRQRLESELQASRDQMARMEEKLQQIIQKEQTPEVSPPDFEADPDAYNAWQLAQINERLAQTEKTAEQQKQEQQKAQQQQNMLNAYAQAADRFSKEKPDLQDAYNFLMESRHKELEVSGIYDPSQREQMIRNDEARVVVNALRSGDNPAERMYELATMRGYKPTQTETDKVESLAKGQGASRTLSTAKGGGEPPVTLQRLSELDGTDFDREWEQAKRKGLLG